MLYLFLGFNPVYISLTPFAVSSVPLPAMLPLRNLLHNIHCAAGTLLDQLVRLPASVATAHAALSQTNPPSIISASPACNPLFKWCNAATALVKQYDELPDELKSVLLNTARASMDAEAEAHILLPDLLIEATESARAAPGTRLYPKGNKAPSPEKAGPRGVAGSASAEGRRKFIVPK